MSNIHPVFQDIIESVAPALEKEADHHYSVGFKDAINTLSRVLEVVATASIEDPGEYDLYDEQPVSVSMTLKEVRLARSLLRKYRKEQA